MKNGGTFPPLSLLITDLAAQLIAPERMWVVKCY